MTDESGTEDEEVSEDVKVMRELLRGEVPINPQGVSQADRIIDRIDQFEKSITETNRDIESSYKDLQRSLEEYMGDVDDQFDKINNRLDTISKKTGIHFPEGTRRTLTLSAAIATITFSIISFLVAIFEGNQISTATQASAAIGLGLLIPEILDYIW